MKSAKEYLEFTSPDNNYGLRAELNKHLLRSKVELLMEKYGEYLLEEFLNEATVERSEVCLCSNTECMHHRGKLCMAAMFNCEDRQTSEA